MTEIVMMSEPTIQASVYIRTHHKIANNLVVRQSRRRNETKQKWSLPDDLYYGGARSPALCRLCCVNEMSWSLVTMMQFVLLSLVKLPHNTSIR